MTTRSSVFNEIHCSTCFLCVCCSSIMHWSKKCTGFEDTVLSALSTVRENVLLFCNNCVQQGRRDLFLNKPAQPEEETDKIAEKTEIVSSSVWNVEKILLNTPAPAAAVEAPEIVKTLRVRGISESKNSASKKSDKATGDCLSAKGHPALHDIETEKRMRRCNNGRSSQL